MAVEHREAHPLAMQSSTWVRMVGEYVWFIGTVVEYEVQPQL